jgi:hypothetical protein
MCNLFYNIKNKYIEEKNEKSRMSTKLTIRRKVQGAFDRAS